MKYDPDHDINPQTWQAADEVERMDCIQDYHRRRKIPLPNATAHAAIHAIVENQIALGDAYAAKSVLERLMREGLSRHEAVHAIGSVLSEQFFKVMKDQITSGDALNATYLDKLNRLTADSWRRIGESPERSKDRSKARH